MYKFNLDQPDSYQILRDVVVSQGQPIAPRGEPTHELLNVSLCVPSGTALQRARYNPAIGIVEGLGLFTEEPGVQEQLDATLQRVAPQSYAAGYFHSGMNYGYRIGTRWTRMIYDLTVDPTSRNAMLYVGDREDEVGGRPCIAMLQAIIRNNALDLIVTMRSLDIILGLPNDIVISSFIHQALGAWLDTQPLGHIHFNVASCHIYDKHLSLDPSSFHVPRTLFRLPNSEGMLQRWSAAAFRTLPEFTPKLSTLDNLALISY